MSSNLHFLHVPYKQHFYPSFYTDASTLKIASARTATTQKKKKDLNEMKMKQKRKKPSFSHTTKSMKPTFTSTHTKVPATPSLATYDSDLQNVKPVLSINTDVSITQNSPIKKKRKQYIQEYRLKSRMLNLPLLKVRIIVCMPWETEREQGHSRASK